MKLKNQESSRRNFLKTAVMSSVAVGAAAAGITKNGLFGEAKAASNTEIKTRWGFGIDLNRCIGCQACAVACKTENDVRLGVQRNGVKTKESGTYPDTKKYFLPWLCNHCEKPPCIVNCPVSSEEYIFTWADGTTIKYKARATYQRPDGIVLVDQARCIGCGNCVNDCPYGARYLDPVKKTSANETAYVADKCTLCAHRVGKGVLPACVDTCQAGARFVTDLKDSTSKVSTMKSSGSVLLQARATSPQVFYDGLAEDFYETGEEVLSGRNKDTLSRRSAIR